MNFKRLITRLVLIWEKDKLRRLKLKLSYYEYRGWTEHIQFLEPIVRRLELRVRDLETRLI